MLLIMYRWFPSPLVETTLGHGNPSEPPSMEKAKTRGILAFGHCPRRLKHTGLYVTQLEVEDLLLVGVMAQV